MARINHKNERTLEVYKRIGAEMRLFKEIESKLFCDISQVIKAADIDKLYHARGVYDLICSKAEDNMFADHPYLGNEYLNVFYGSLKDEPVFPVDGEILELAKETVRELFESAVD